jgi:hypothetical protein
MKIKAAWCLFRQTQFKFQNVSLFRGLADKTLAEQQRKKFDRKSNRTNHITMTYYTSLSVASTYSLSQQSR